MYYIFHDAAKIKSRNNFRLLTRLISESIEIDNESVMLEQALRAKHQELADLRQQIEDVGSVGGWS
jgi:hypothetical protein